MDFDKIFADVLQYIQANIAGSVAAGIILLYLLIKKPKLLFILILLGIVGIGFMHIYDKIAATGITEKEFDALKEVK